MLAKAAEVTSLIFRGALATLQQEYWLAGCLGRQIPRDSSASLQILGVNNLVITPLHNVAV